MISTKKTVFWYKRNRSRSTRWRLCHIFCLVGVAKHYDSYREDLLAERSFALAANFAASCETSFQSFQHCTAFYCLFTWKFCARNKSEIS